MQQKFSAALISVLASSVFAACDTLPAPGSATIDFTQIQTIFTVNCALSGCHTGASPSGGLNLAAGQSLAQIVNVNAVAIPSRLRVKPADPDNSFLFEKINCAPPASGSRMPLGSAPLSIADQAAIRDWILQGANGSSGGGNAQPVLSSGPAASPSPAAVGAAVAFSAAATDADNDTLTFAWTLGDGSTAATASGTHVYTSAGVFTLTVTVTDGKGGTATGSTTVTVQGQINLDEDADGFRNELEVALGTSPTDGASTPLGGAAAPAAQVLTIVKGAIKLNFTKTLSDSISISGTLPVSAGFVVANQQLAVDIGGIVKVFTLDVKGQSPKGQTQAFKLSVKNSKAGVVAQQAAFKTTFSKGSFGAGLADEGLTGAATVKLAPRNVDMTVFFDRQLFFVTRAMLYSAKQDKTGSAK